MLGQDRGQRAHRHAFGGIGHPEFGRGPGLTFDHGGEPVQTVEGVEVRLALAAADKTA